MTTATSPVVRVFVRRPGGRWKLLGLFTDRAVGFAAADPWPLIYLNDQPTADPPPGFETLSCRSSGADEKGAPATPAGPDD